MVAVAERIPMQTTGKIFGAIIGAKRKVGAVGKNGKVKEHGNYDYRRFDDVLDAVAPLLDEFGILVVPTVLGRDERQSGKLHFVTMTMSYRLYAEDGSYVEGSAVGEAFDVGDKAATKAQTVALRIMYCTTLNIPYNDMVDPESGQQGSWTEKNQKTMSKFTGLLDTIQDSKRLRPILEDAIRCLNSTQENGDHLTKDELKRLKEVFTASARRLRFGENVVGTIENMINSAISGNVPDESSKQAMAVEPVKFRELNFDFGTADTDEKRERCVLTCLQSYRTGHIDHGEVGQIVASHCPDDESNGAACYLLGVLYNCETASEIAGMSDAIHIAEQRKQLGKDAAMALSQYAQHLIEKVGKSNVDNQ